MPFSFILSVAAGFATMIGAVLAVLSRKPPKGLLNFALGLSAGVMTAMSLMDLLPHSMRVLAIEMPGMTGTAAMLCACAAGMLAARFLDLLVCEKGGENRLFKVGIFSMLALMLHNIPEGMAVYLSAEHDVVLGLHLCAAIALHNIPEGIAVAMPICAATKSRAKALGLAAVSGLAEPLGAVLTQRFIGARPTERGLALIFAAIAGIMLATAVYELLPEAFCGKERENGESGVLFGFIIMALGCCLAA